MDQPIESSLPNTPFTRQDALQNGLLLSRLKRGDVVNVSKSIYRPADWDFDLVDAARVLSEATPNAWISHTTAARIHGLILPSWLSSSNELHLSKARNLPSSRRKGVFGHTLLAFEDELEISGGIRLSTRAKTWLDLASILPLYDLVALGDQLIRIPRPIFEGRSEPFTTVAKLQIMVSRHRNLQGIVTAREALELMRIGADSAPETMLRLAMHDAALPEPELQVKLFDRDDAPSADLGYRSRKIAIQYDGAHHLDDEQRFSDRRRDKQFVRAGWTVLVFDRTDLEDQFNTAIPRIKKALRGSWVDPAIQAGFQ